MSWRKLPSLKCVWVQQVEDYVEKMENTCSSSDNIDDEDYVKTTEFVWRMFQMFIIAYSKNMCQKIYEMFVLFIKTNWFAWMFEQVLKK